MKYLGSDGDIDLSETQYIWLLGSNIISKGIENSYVKKNDISTFNDHTLIEFIKDEMMTFQNKIKYFTTEKKVVTSIDSQLGEDKHRYSNLYPPKLFMSF